MFNYQPMASLPLQLPSPTVLTRSYKDTKRATLFIKRHLGNGTLKSVSKIENRTIVKFYCTGHRVDFHNWGFDYAENKRVREQASTTYVLSTCTALVLVSK